MIWPIIGFPAMVKKEVAYGQWSVSTFQLAGLCTRVCPTNHYCEPLTLIFKSFNAAS